MSQPPASEPALKTIAMPADANPSGDIFGGWLLAQMDLAGGVAAQRRARGRVATVAVDAMEFKLPVFVGDEVACYARIERTGRTSLTIRVDVWATRMRSFERVAVTTGLFTYVAIGEDRRPRPLPEAGA
jgi:acyl-CoA thioesterase YciA